MRDLGAAKIKTLDKLTLVLEGLRTEGKRIVHCHGPFPFVEARDARLLACAKAAGDVLVVTLAEDESPSKEGSVPERLRAELLAALPMVDFVSVTPWPTAIETLRLVRPQVFAVLPGQWDGPALDGSARHEETIARAIGGTILHLAEAVETPRATPRGRSRLAPDVTSWLEGFKLRYGVADVRQSVSSTRRLRALIVGESILDEYVSCDAIGKSGKEPMLVMQYRGCERHAGGVLAIANHAAEFCRRVDLLSSLGTVDTNEEFVRSSLRASVTSRFVLQPNAPTIVKRRYLDVYSRAKLFGMYRLPEGQLSGEVEASFCQSLEGLLSDADVVIVADYGHGLITPRAADILSKRARFLAVNTQLNAANTGFHTISKYPRADYVCVHEGELRLDARRPSGDVRPLVEDLSRRLKCDSVMVTQGSRGSLFYRQGEGFSATPALAETIVDRMGAGDAVLSLTSLLVAAHVPGDLVGYLGNLAGAQAVSILGNAESISAGKLMETVCDQLGARPSLRRIVA